MRLLVAAEVPYKVTSMGIGGVFQGYSEEFVLYCMEGSYTHDYTVEFNYNYQFGAMPMPVTSVTLSQPTVELKEGESVTLTATSCDDSGKLAECEITITEAAAEPEEKPSETPEEEPTEKPDETPEADTENNKTNGLAADTTGTWHLYEDGEVKIAYNGLYNDVNVGWWLVTGGASGFGYTGVVYYDGAPYNVVNGQLV